jgi:hypothetical protein
MDDADHPQLIIAAYLLLQVTTWRICAVTYISPPVAPKLDAACASLSGAQGSGCMSSLEINHADDGRNVSRWQCWLLGGCFESNANRGPCNRLLSDVLECCDFNLWLCFEFHGTILFGLSPIGKQALCVAAPGQAVSCQPLSSNDAISSPSCQATTMLTEVGCDCCAQLIHAMYLLLVRYTQSTDSLDSSLRFLAIRARPASVLIRRRDLTGHQIDVSSRI